jgi:hypothetical protein
MGPTTEDTMITGSARIALAIELSKLHQLTDVDWVWKRVDSALVALRGGDGIDEREVAEVREMAARWLLLDPKLRTFYAVNAADDKTASIALWMLLTRPYESGFLSGMVAGRLYQLWEDQFGSRPSISLYPRLHPREDR